MQFRVLYREFLFRVLDLEILSAHALGDVTKLLGQFAALLIFVSLILTLGAFGFAGANLAPGMALVLTLISEHFLIATTMLVVGLFAVLSWDSTFPDRRDVLVLAPLPVNPRTMFLAKVAAVASSLILTVALLHSFMGFVWPFAFATQAVPQVVPLLTFDPSPVPVPAGDLQSVLHRDLEPLLRNGNTGLSIGVYRRGVRRVFTYGTAKPDSLFEIGSLTKTFTALALARMVEEGKVRLNEPVRDLLPAGTVSKPVGREITLLDLVTHQSGLPGSPANFHPADMSDPFADYTVENLYAFLAKHGVARRADASFRYSNLGFGLLGQALSERAGMSYSDLLREQVTGPLGLNDTVVSVSAEQQRRVIQGHTGQHVPVPAWHLDAFAGAGAIRSTAGDLLTYLEANLHPERFPSLAAALRQTHRLRANVSASQQISLAWFYRRDSETFSHSGRTAGFSTSAFFHPRDDYAVVALLNHGSFLLNAADFLDEHIRQRLAGEPAVSLDSVLVPASSGVSGAARWFLAYWFTMLAASLFIYCAVLSVQGCAAQLLPRRFFLRVSGPLQLVSFCLVVCMYFLQPVVSPDSVDAPALRRLLPWLPSYWFLGLFHQLNGSMHPALAPLAWRAWMGLGIVVCGTGVAYTLSYIRTIRQIVEEPDITAGSRRSGWLPSFGNSVQTAIGQFTVRTLLRSRQHRLILAFYLGIGFALTVFLLKAPAMKPQLPDAASNGVWREADTPLLASSIMLLVLAMVGTRVVFSLPLDPRANWVFQVIGVRGGRAVLASCRRALLFLSLAPVWLLAAVLCLWLWPWQQASGHLLVLWLIGILVADICLYGFRKIPFTCPYLPGKSQVHMVFLGAAGLMWFIALSVRLERVALMDSRGMVAMLMVMLFVAACVRLVTREQKDAELEFEETPDPAVLELGIQGD